MDLQLSPMAPTTRTKKGMSTNHVEPKTGSSSLHLFHRGKGGGVSQCMQKLWVWLL